MSTQFFLREQACKGCCTHQPLDPAKIPYHKLPRHSLWHCVMCMHVSRMLDPERSRRSVRMYFCYRRDWVSLPDFIVCMSTAVLRFSSSYKLPSTYLGLVVACPPFADRTRQERNAGCGASSAGCAGAAGLARQGGERRSEDHPAYGGG